MAALPSVRLNTDELSRGPWIFARSVDEPEGGAVEPGGLVEVLDKSERFVGHALYNPASDIRLRFLSRGRRTDLDRPGQFLEARLREADRLRRRTLRLEERTDAYRVVHAEGDDLSGLVVDRLGPALVVEYHALGFWRLREEVAAALGRIYPGLAVLHTVAASAVGPEGFGPALSAASWRESDPQEVEIRENGLSFPVEAGGRHKTGWFCDQRENRLRVASLAAGREVLDLCTNGGGFALQAARAGARAVRAVDLDERAVERVRRAAAANELAVDAVHADLFDHLRQMAAGERSADLVVLDPHKLIATQARYDEGLRRYSDMNTLAFERTRPGGLVASFSCSGLLDLPEFLGMIFGAARRARRELRLLEVLGAGPDHPQRPGFSRSRYLKGALLALD